MALLTTEEDREDFLLFWFLFVLLSHLNMNGITSLNYPKVAFESWSLPAPGRKTLGLTCAGFVSSGSEIQIEIVVIIINTIAYFASRNSLK